MERPRLKKHLGQHHLHRAGLCAPVIRFLDPDKGPAVEIGPGGGVLTRELLESGRTVLAWEIDVPWAFELRRRLNDHPGLSVVIGDALEIPWGALPSGAVAAGNLPYAIATRLILDLARSRGGVRRGAFLVQLEVAERLLAGPGEPAYGALSVLARAWSEVSMLRRIGRGSFSPPPKVDGALIGMELRPPPLPVEEMPDFEKTVRLAFAKRRKTLRNALSAGRGRGEVDGVLSELGWDSRCRAERLSLADFLSLHAALDRRPGEAGPVEAND